MKMNVQVIPVNLTSVTTDTPISDVPCGTCSFCCTKLSPFLTPEEIGSGLYPFSLVEATEESRFSNPNAGPTIVLYRSPSGGCSMLKDNRCSIYDHRPLSCRQFDCRKGHHPKIPDMTKS